MLPLSQVREAHGDAGPLGFPWCMGEENMDAMAQGCEASVGAKRNGEGRRAAMLLDETAEWGMGAVDEETKRR